MSLAERDVVIVGGGHNGLACAAYLAKGGLDVEVVERTPIGGLYLCRGGTHPGGGVMGVPGRNAYTVVPKDLRRGRGFVRIRDLVSDR